MLFKLCKVALAVLIISATCAAQESTPSAQSIVEQVLQKYVSLSSYQDSGVVEHTFKRSTGDTFNADPFETRFARPNLFRFEWTNTSSVWPQPVKNAVWTDGRQSYIYTGHTKDDAAEPTESLRSAVASATGISGGSAYYVPALLMPEIGGRLRDILNSLSVQGSEIIEGHDCYVLSKVEANGRRFTVWIGKVDHLIYKLKMVLNSPTRTIITEETHRNIVLNGDIPREAFTFRPQPEANK